MLLKSYLQVETIILLLERRMEMENNKIIYKATNSVNGFVYVGATTKTIRDRKKDHLSKATSGESGKFQEAISTYGAEAFFWEQIDTASSIDELALKEKQYIQEKVCARSRPRIQEDQCRQRCDAG